jgi:enoyl-CoA hydratase/carnithine racemase
MEIALFADTVLAAHGARFGFPEINHGLLPADKGVQRAIRMLGARVTRQILLSGELFDAQRALEIGIVDGLVAPADLVDAALTSAREAAAKAPVLYGALKCSVNDPDDDRDQTYLQRTLAAAARYFDDPTARGLRESWNDNRSGGGRG